MGSLIPFSWHDGNDADSDPPSSLDLRDLTHSTGDDHVPSQKNKTNDIWEPKMSRSRVTNKLGFLQVCFYQRSTVSGLDTPVSIHWCYLPNLETCSIESGRKHVVLRPLYDLNMIWIYYLVSLIFRESHHIQIIFKSYSGWWFGTMEFYDVPIILGSCHPKWLNWISRPQRLWYFHWLS
jgi:hypothetical protein